jgi:hypothetical protein
MNGGCLIGCEPANSPTSDALISCLAASCKNVCS